LKSLHPGPGPNCSILIKALSGTLALQHFKYLPTKIARQGFLFILVKYISSNFEMAQKFRTLQLLLLSKQLCRLKENNLLIQMHQKT